MNNLNATTTKTKQTNNMHDDIKCTQCARTHVLDIGVWIAPQNIL